MQEGKEKLFEQLNLKKNILIVIPDNSDKEITCAALAFYNFLKSVNKNTTIFSIKPPDPSLNFLEGFGFIKRNSKSISDFTISIKTSGSGQIKDIKYEKINNIFNIYLDISRQNPLNAQNIEIIPSNKAYDLIIVPGSPDLNSVGRFFQQNSQLFFNTPIVNLDYHISNEGYGQINIVDFKVSGVSELIFNLLETKDFTLNNQIADCLYTGLLEATQSFQSPKTTPKTLNIAAKLIDSGADHKNIVKNLYKTHDINTIKLWGELMSKMDYKPEIHLCWTKIYQEKLKSFKANTQTIRTIFNKIRNVYSKTDILLILWQTKQDTTRGLIQNSNQEQLKELTNGIEWGKAVIFEFNQKMEKTEEKLLKILNKQLREF
ncbi:MAG: hypothetical protein GF335_03765 [Candidatus Moranbacteria bacterium]|nr:hypothetical protein [Candidatus Moranbacteria bacterium]